MATYAEQLAEVETAITAVMSGQSYSIAGRSLQRADLGELQKRQQWLTGMAAREARGTSGIRVRGATPT